MALLKRPFINIQKKVMSKNVKPNTGLVIIITFISKTNIEKINIFNLHLGKNIIP